MPFEQAQRRKNRLWIGEDNSHRGLGVPRVFRKKPETLRLDCVRDKERREENNAPCLCLLSVEKALGHSRVQCRQEAQTIEQELMLRHVRTCELLLTLGPSGLETDEPEDLVRSEASLCVGGAQVSLGTQEKAVKMVLGFRSS